MRDDLSPGLKYAVMGWCFFAGVAVALLTLAMSGALGG